jgi:twitching motility protein PilT
MVATGTARVQVSLDESSASAATDDLLTAILRANPRVSDLIFSPGRKFQVQVNGEFVPVEMPGSFLLTADNTRRIASDLIGNNKAAIAQLREQGSCDVSYALAGVARFRVNVFIQRGSCAVVMRVIPTLVPDFKTLGLPEQLRQISTLEDGLVLVTGPRGSGKSSTLAALIDYINETRTCHIITIEDPIEFLHNHKRATIHQRELHSDTPSVSHAMRAALRQVPNVIAVGELKDRGTVGLALEAAETGHVVLSTLNTLTAQQTIERLVGLFSSSEREAVRERLGTMLRLLICQRLVPSSHNGKRVAEFEILNGDSPQLHRVLANDVPVRHQNRSSGHRQETSSR